MLETSAIWTIVGPDGSTLIFNNGASGLYLEGVTGFDSPNVRTNVEDLPEFDGAIAGDSFYGQRPVTLTGKVVGSSAAQRNNLVVSMQRALRGLRGDITLKSQAQGLPAMQVTARFDNMRVTGGYVKDFQIALTCPDPRMYSQAVTTGTARAVGVTLGAAFPWTFPVNFGGGLGAAVAVNVTNAGNFTTFPTIRIIGPLSNFEIRSVTQVQSLFVGYSLSAGEYIDFDFRNRTVTKSDGTNLYSRITFPGSSWFTLDPGSNTIQLWAGGTSGATEMDVTYRDAWA